MAFILSRKDDMLAEGSGGFTRRAANELAEQGRGKLRGRENETQL